MEAQENNMEELLKMFDNCFQRKYKDGVEIRTKNLEHSLEVSRKAIQNRNLKVEIFEIDHRVNSLSIREVK